MKSEKESTTAKPECFWFSDFMRTSYLSDLEHGNIAIEQDIILNSIHSSWQLPKANNYVIWISKWIRAYCSYFITSYRSRREMTLENDFDFNMDLEIDDFIQTILSDEPARPLKRRHACIENDDLEWMMNNKMRASKTNEKATCL